MKQRPVYIQDLFVINEHSRSKRCFPLVQPQFKTQRYGFNSFSYKASNHWNLLDNCYKDPTALANWQLLYGCATCDIMHLREVWYTRSFNVYTFFLRIIIVIYTYRNHVGK